MGEQFIRKRASAYKVQSDRALRGFASPNLWSARPEVLVIDHVFDLVGPCPSPGAVLTVECHGDGVRAIDDAVEVGRSESGELRATLAEVGSVAAAEVVEVSPLGAMTLRLCEEKEEPK
jgi:hypothetical protein